MDAALYERVKTAPPQPQNTETIEGGDLTGADLTNCDFSHNFRFHFSGATLAGCKMRHAELCKFVGAKMRGFENLQNLLKCNFQKADMRGMISGLGTNIQESDLTDADLRGAIFDGASLMGGTFERANVAGASMLRANVTVPFLRACNIPRTKHFASVNSLGNIGYADLSQIPLSFIDRVANWHRIRAIGELPLFGFSYSALAAVLLVIGYASIYNALLSRFESSPHSLVIQQLGSTLPAYTVSYTEWLVLFSSLLLVIATTIYRIQCPSRIKENTITYWTDVLDKPVLQYIGLAWQGRSWRMPCALCYLIGGVTGIGVLIWKIWRAVTFMLEHTVLN